ncbi:hypothetical protein E4T48_07989 [Aureobasidium sp. EXF-10727]|nr:hypothetical protein E4T48_07989 [Aureobasidium sp. EXF-10727]
MLRNRPSRVPLGMADVNQTKQRLKLKQASHPLVAQTDRPCAHNQQQNIRIAPQPHYNLREGPQRSRDASVVQLDPNRHVPQFAIYESTDSAEESDSDETASATFESVARLVHIAEVSPTITQVSGYNPPALVHPPSETSRVHASRHPGVITGHHHPNTSLTPVRYRYNNRSGSGPATRPGYSYQPSRQTANHSHHGNGNPRIADLSQRGHNPNAVSFSPRVHFESALQELPPHHRSNVASINRRGGTLRARPSTSRISHTGRAEMNYQTRPRPMPRPRGSLMPRRPSARGARRTGGHIRPPAASSIDTVMDHGHLLSGDAFYSDSDDGTNERETKKDDHPRRRDSAHVDGYNMDRPLSRQPQHDLGMTARIVDVEVDCQSATIRPLPVPSSSQSVSSTPGIDASLVDSSPPGDLPDLPPTTPGRQSVQPTRNPYTPCAGPKSQATPRLRVYDDCQPASMQPQTPADLNHRFRTRVPDSSDMPATRQSARSFATSPPVEQSSLIPSRNTHRNTYPSFQQATSQPHLTNSQPSSPYSPNLDLRTAAAITAVGRRRTARALSNENVIDPRTNGMETERDAMLSRREEHGTNTMDDTPPRQVGIFEGLTSRLRWFTMK